MKWIDIDSSDRLEIYDGGTESDSPSSLMASLYGKVAPSETYTTESSVAQIRFYSDGDDEGKGFVLIYRFIVEEDDNPGDIQKPMILAINNLTQRFLIDFIK